MSGRPDLRTALTGVTAVLVTAYTPDGPVDPDGCAALARRVDTAGVPCVTVLGNTAEIHQLTGAERQAILAAVIGSRSGAAYLAGATGAVGEVLATASAASTLGYDGLLLHETPDPFGDSAGIAAYCEAVADSSPLPVVLYLRTDRLADDDLVRVLRHTNVPAVKFARSDRSSLPRLQAAVGEDCIWINGTAESNALEFAGYGITAFTSGIANARPDLALEVHRRLTTEPDDAASLVNELLPIERCRTADVNRHNVAVIKELLRLQGTETGGVRPPHAALGDDERRLVHRIAATWTVAVATESAGAR